MKTCHRCRVAKPLESFTKHSGGLQGRRPECNQCRIELRSTPTARAKAVRNHAARKIKTNERRALIDAIKIASGCVDCGYRDHAVALDFDHANERKKGATHGISYLVKSATDWVTVEAEIAKCEIVCANCHRVRTKERGDWSPGRRPHPVDSKQTSDAPGGIQ